MTKNTIACFMEWLNWFKAGESKKNNDEALHNGRLYATRGIIWKKDFPVKKAV